MDTTTTTPNARRHLNNDGSLAAAAASLPPPAVANMGDIIHTPCPPRPRGVLCQQCFEDNDNDHHDNEDQANKDNFPSSQGIQFSLRLGNDIDGVNKTGGAHDDVGKDDEGGGISEGTIVPGTQLPLNDTILAPLHCKVAGHKVPDLNLPGIDPDQEQWIRQAMKDDWGINFPHEFQVRAINNIAFCHDWLVYIIAKTGSGKSAISRTVGSLQTGITLTMAPLIRLGSNQVNSVQNGDNFIEAYHLDKHRGVFGKDLCKQLLSLHPLKADHV
jgi:hypothetical protein